MALFPDRPGIVVAAVLVFGAPAILGGAAGGAADAQDGSIWVLSRVDRSVTVIDPVAAAPAARIRLGFRSDPGDLVYRAGSVWVGSSGGSLQRIDVAARSLAATVPLEMDAVAVSAADHGVYAMDAELGIVTRHDLASGDLLATLDVPDRIHAMAASPDATAVLVGDRRELHFFPAGSTESRVVTAELGGGDMVLGFGSFWIYNPDGRLLRVDPAAGSIQAEIPVGEGLYFPGISAGEAAVWVASPDDGAVLRIDPVTDQLSARIPVDGAPAHAAEVAGALWVALPQNDAVIRIDPGSGRETARVRVDGALRVIAVPR
jgi:virginiamycin B lyase